MSTTKSPSVSVKPSKKLIEYIKEVCVNDAIPTGINNIFFKNHVRSMKAEYIKNNYLITPDDREFIKTIFADTNNTLTKSPLIRFSSDTNSDNQLTLKDLHWLYGYINKKNQNSKNKVYLHELIEGSEIILPKHQEIPRNPELENRCKKLRAQQQNKNYHDMTRNVDNIRKKYPENSLAFQLKLLNSHLVAIFQFIVSIAAGFTFGFVGGEVLFGTPHLRFKLLFGITCALIIALAELYFLTKKLTQDLQFEYKVRQD